MPALNRPSGRPAAFLLVACAYLLALGAAVAVAALAGPGHPVRTALLADLAATLVIYLASCLFHNASFYDPYWSVAPPLLAGAWALQAAHLTGRGVLVLALVLAWGVRLTASWAAGWRGLGHEDWRYAELRQKAGRWFWLVNLTGIELMPTMVVFLGCLALYPALASRAPLGLLDVLGLLLAGGGILLEAVADAELRRFTADSPPGALLTRGVWAWSRHPNYLGELSFWWGLGLFALGAGLANWRTLVGALAVSALFAGVSLPLMERHNAARRPGWAAYCRTTPLLLPRLRWGGALRRVAPP